MIFPEDVHGGLSAVKPSAGGRKLPTGGTGSTGSLKGGGSVVTLMIKFTNASMPQDTVKFVLPASGC